MVSFYQQEGKSLRESPTIGLMWCIALGYPARLLRELGFTVTELSEHYDAREIVDAGFLKENLVLLRLCASFRIAFKQM